MDNTIHKSIKLLDKLAEKSRTVPELCRILSYPKSTVHKIITNLAELGVVQRNPGTHSYSLGLKLIELGNRAQLDLGVRRVANPYMHGINQTIDETVYLTLLGNGVIVYVDCVESSKRIRSYPVAGIKAPMHCNALGKAILAFLDRDVVHNIIREKELIRLTANTITTEEELLKDLELTRNRGYAIDNMESEDHLRCVASPIFDSHGRAFAAMSISGPAIRVTMEEIPRFAGLLIEATQEISRHLGFHQEQ
jgi:DNA-binding IclR family transcriptional regulator